MNATVEALTKAMIEQGRQNADVQIALANGLAHVNDNLALVAFALKVLPFFRSANAIPVERATIRAEQLEPELSTVLGK